MSKTKQNWNDIYKNKGIMRYPNEDLVVLFHQIKHLLPKKITALDYGFGSGNNASFLIDMVEDFYGIEVSSVAKEITTARLADHNKFNANNLYMSLNKNIAEFNNKFDLIVAWHVISYNSHESVQEVIKRFLGYLKPGGLLITTLATPRDISKSCSDKLSHNTYKITESIPNQEGCTVIIPQNEEDFKQYFSDYKVVDIGYLERVSFKLAHNSSHYFGVFQK